jgi:diacylglycerol kinase family enzyme
MMIKVLYNPLAGAVNDTSFFSNLKELYKGESVEFYDVTKIENMGEYLSSVEASDKVIIAGGDGTINHFINNVDVENLAHEVYYYPAGSGNDFWTDIGKKIGDDPVLLTPYIKNLPTVTVKGKEYKFINGVGYGVDGYCCEVADKLKEKGKKPNYTGIAIKGLLFHFKAPNAEVIVDGVTKTYKRVWIAPTMNGRYYGGGMIPTPAQDRLSPEHTVSTCLMYRKGKIRTLMLFPSIFKGQHIKDKKAVDILSGHKITVKFAHPCALQIDGETILIVSEYTVNK